MRFVEYFEDIQALEDKIGCVDLELAEAAKVKDRLMKSLKKRVNRLPDTYDDDKA